MTNAIELRQAHRQMWDHCTSRPFTTREAEFATLVRNAALEEAAQKCEYVGPQGSALSVINSAFAHEIRNLKDKT